MNFILILKKTFWSLFWLAIYFYAFVAYVTGFGTGLSVYSAIGCLVLGSLVATLVHEIGHAMAAHLVGWQVIVFAVKPIAVRLPNPSVAVDRDRHERGVIGWVASIPKCKAVATAHRYGWIVAGGPLASAAFGLVLLIFGADVLRYFNCHEGLQAHICAGLGIQSLAVFIATLSLSERSDGSKLVDLLRKGEKSTLLHPIGWYGTLFHNEVRLRDRPAWLIDAAQPALRKAGMGDANFDALTVGRALDAKDVNVIEARMLLDAYRQQHAANDWLTSCDAYLCAVFEHDLSQAKTLLARRYGPPEIPQLVCAAEAAVAAAEGDVALTRRTLTAMDRFVNAKARFRDATYRDIRRNIERLLAERIASNTNTNTL